MRTPIAKLAKITEDAKVAPGPSRDLDTAVWAYLQGVEATIDCSGTGERLEVTGTLRNPEWSGPPEMTGSVDLMFEVVQMFFPGRGTELVTTGQGEARSARCGIWHRDDAGKYLGRGPTQPLAILNAFLEALACETIRLIPIEDRIPPLEDLWVKEFGRQGLCCLCGNHGVIDTRGKVFSPAGVECGDRVFCICPNGRRMKERGFAL